MPGDLVETVPQTPELHDDVSQELVEVWRYEVSLLEVGQGRVTEEWCNGYALTLGCLCDALILLFGETRIRASVSHGWVGEGITCEPPESLRLCGGSKGFSPRHEPKASLGKVTPLGQDSQLC